MTNELTLFDYQIEGANWLSTKKVALLADEMGLGKSAQAITASDKMGAKRILVVCPAIARINWQREFQKFSVKQHEFDVIFKRQKVWDKNKSIITSFESMISVEKPGDFDLLIIDEAHFLKTRDSKRTKFLFGKTGLVRRCQNVWALTGTPAPNHAGELWPLLKIFGATEMKYQEFIFEFCDSYMGNYGPVITGTRAARIPKLKQLLKPIMLRRKKEDVMKQLPPIFYSDVVVEASELELELLDSFFKYTTSPAMRQELERILERDRMLVAAMLDAKDVKGASLIKSLEAMAASVSTLRRFNGMQKVKAVGDLIADELQQNQYQKIVIFAVHRDVIEGLRNRLRPFGVAALYGGYEPEKKQRNIDRFQKNPQCRVMLANIQTAGTAVTLTASSQVAFIEQDWVPGNNAQAVMRCHRIGQKYPVFVRFFSIADSIDERISKVLKRKTKELTEIFDNEIMDKTSIDQYTNGQEQDKLYKQKPEAEDIFS